MKLLRVSIALSVSLLSAGVIEQAKAAGDPNLDSGIGSGASRGPYGFNNTGNIPVYDDPPNNYGVYRDVYGGFRDKGMIPDNLYERVPELTWIQAHPPGPPKLAGSPGGLGGGGYGFGGLGLLGGGLNTPLGGGLGAFGAFSGIAPLATAAAAALTNPLPVGGGKAIGPTALQPRTAYGFAGSPGIFNTSYPYLGGPYLGPQSGYLVNPSVTASNTTGANGLSTSKWTWNTTYGPATLTQVATPNSNNTQQNVVDTFTLNGNTYSTSTVINAPAGITSTIGGSAGTTASTSASTTTNTSTGSTTSTTTTANTPLFPGFNFLPTPPLNGSITSSLTTGNAQQNPTAVNGPAGYVNQNYLSQTTEPGNFGATFNAPQTMGQQSSQFWTNNFGIGNFGAMFAGPMTDGTQKSVFFNGNFNSGNFGSMFATPATDGSQYSFRYPNPNINNGIGIPTGGLGTVAFGLPGYNTPNDSSLFPGLASGSGYGYAGLSGYPYVGGAPEPEGPASAQPGNYYSDGSLVQEQGGSTFINGSVAQPPPPPAATTSGAPINVFLNGAAGMAPAAGYVPMAAPYPAGGGAANAAGNNMALPPSPRGTAGNGSGGGFTGAVGPSAPVLIGPAPTGVTLQTGTIERTPGNTGTQWSVQTLVEPPLLPPPGLLNADRPMPVNLGYGGRANRHRQPVCDNSPDGACGFFGGAPAAITALNHGLHNSDRLPYLGYPLTPMGTYVGARVLAVRMDNAIGAAGPTTPTTTLASELECRLAARKLPLDKALGRVIGSMRFASGEILTYGTGATLHLAVDNSGSLTFNDGEVVTFTHAPPCLRQIALQSTVIF
jgi:hypothetical protein